MEGLVDQRKVLVVPREEEARAGLGCQEEAAGEYQKGSEDEAVISIIIAMQRVMPRRSTGHSAGASMEDAWDSPPLRMEARQHRSRSCSFTRRPSGSAC